MSKFKVGDKIIAKENAPYVITADGWTGVVTEVKNGLINAKGKGLFDESNFLNLEEKYFDLVPESKIIITTDGVKTVTAKLYEGKKLIKTAEAKCSPEDKFDFGYGAAVTIERLTGHVYGKLENTLEVKPKELLKNGLFGKSKYGWFVVVGDKFIYESGGFNDALVYDDDLRYRDVDHVKCLVEAVSFNNAKTSYEHNDCVIWKR